jgi:hypothetical protein
MYLSLEYFNSRPATQIVSLGRACKTAFNLRRFFDFSGAFPFDWWYSEPEALLSFLRSMDVDALYHPDLIELSEDGKSVTNKRFPVLLHHEFPRDYSAPGQPIADGWRGAVGKARQRTAALIDKFKALNSEGNRVAFFREGPTPETAFISALATLLDCAEWTYVPVDLADEPEFEWKGDPRKWDDLLRATGVRLDRTNHRPFALDTDPNLDP